MAVFRRERVQNRIAQIISELILREEIKDHRVRGVLSISAVIISKDAAYAKVMLSGLLERDKLLQAVDGLNSASGFIQRTIASRLRMRHTPQLRFVADDGIAQGFEIAERLKTLKTSDPPPSESAKSEAPFARPKSAPISDKSLPDSEAIDKSLPTRPVPEPSDNS